MNIAVGGQSAHVTGIPNVQFANQLQTNLADVSALFKQVSKGSKTSELLSQASKAFASTDQSISSTENTFHKLSALAVHLSYQQEAIQKSLETTGNVHEQLLSLNHLIANRDH